MDQDFTDGLRQFPGLLEAATQEGPLHQAVEIRDGWVQQQENLQTPIPEAYLKAFGAGADKGGEEGP